MDFFAGVTSVPGDPTRRHMTRRVGPRQWHDRAKIDRTESTFRPNPGGTSAAKQKRARGILRHVFHTKIAEGC